MSNPSRKIKYVNVVKTKIPIELGINRVGHMEPPVPEETRPTPITKSMEAGGPIIKASKIR